MRPLRFIRSHPVLVLGVLVAAFAGWVWIDVFREKEPRLVGGPEGGNPNLDVDVPTFEGEVVLEPAPQRRVLPPNEGEKPNPQRTARVLPKLKPGMTRTEVEGLVGVPAPQDIHPVRVSNGKVTYLASYDADLAPIQTVRPIRPTHPMGQPTPPATRTFVTLEFDATKPGHPLIEVHYPDPLF
ncbi:MAG: hypothetical protein L0241_04950 [Planctomycetia bacterium]|nr:hypothetical protein [Planctomycetia bacterium]